MEESDWLTSTDPEAMLEHLLYPYSIVSEHKLQCFVEAATGITAWFNVSNQDWNWWAEFAYEVAHKHRNESPALIHDIFGNAFRRFVPGPEYATLNMAGGVPTDWLTWNDGTVPKLAQAIYDERAFDRMPILADALEEAGCTNEDILMHCRKREREYRLLPKGEPSQGKEWQFLGWRPSDSPHVRGCFVLDLLLGKS